MCGGVLVSVWYFVIASLSMFLMKGVYVVLSLVGGLSSWFSFLFCLLLQAFFVSVAKQCSSKSLTVFVGPMCVWSSEMSEYSFGCVYWMKLCVMCLALFMVDVVSCLNLATYDRMGVMY